VNRLPDSPEDRRRRNELLQRVALRLVIVLIPAAIVGALAVALGVPVWLVVVVCLVFAGIIIFEA
jgi:heme A synthase